MFLLRRLSRRISGQLMDVGSDGSELRTASQLLKAGSLSPADLSGPRRSAGSGSLLGLTAGWAWMAPFLEARKDPNLNYY